MTMTAEPWLNQLTIGAVLAHTASRFPDRDALIFTQTNTRMTYREFHAAVQATAKGLLALGIKPGEHVGIWATNLPEWV